MEISGDGRATVALLGMLLNRLGREVVERLAAAGFADVRRGHGDVMQQLIHHDGLRLGVLAETAGMTPQSMGEIVDNLENLGYVERRPDPSDRRAKLIFLAPKGRAGVAVSDRVVAEQERALKKLLGDAGYHRLRALLLTTINGTGHAVTGPRLHSDDGTP